MARAKTTRFTVIGIVAGQRVTIAWTEKGGFVDPTDRTALMIDGADQVCGTVTGPCWPAAAKPAVVALADGQTVIGGDHLVGRRRWIRA